MADLEQLATYTAVKDYLFGLKNRGSKYGIDRMRLFVDALGHPERAFPSIHVAGTNGKGSTCALLESIYRMAGYRTGLFTSPHLVYQGERVQVNRRLLPHSEVVRLVRQLVPVAEQLAAVDADDHPSFFEFVTAMAFLRFADQGVQIALLETGLGGRLDATNVVDPELSIITSISLDHCDILGDTHAKIAAEKAGIIKEGKPVLMGCLPEEAEAVVRRRAAELGCKTYHVRDFYPNAESYPRSALHGGYQRLNAALAVSAVHLLQDRFPVADTAMADGLAHVTWAGRWDRHQLGDREVIFDAAHNPEGAACLRSNLETRRAEGGTDPVAVVGVLGRARAEAVMDVVAQFAREIILVRPNQGRACSLEELRELVPSSFSGIIREGDVSALFPEAGACTAGQPGDTVLVTGSIYLIGEVMEALYHELPVGEDTLQD